MIAVECVMKKREILVKYLYTCSLKYIQALYTLLDDEERGIPSPSPGIIANGAIHAQKNSKMRTTKHFSFLFSVERNSPITRVLLILIFPLLFPPFSPYKYARGVSVLYLVQCASNEL